MSKALFAFKQFSVRQDKSTMKIGTDSVLLGSWADVSHCRNILDIGSGTGVVALMLAQRAPKAEIDAIDLDEDSYCQSAENFRDSPWHARLKCYHYALQKFKPGCKYDLIVSNPPYFTMPKSYGERRNPKARYNTHLTFSELAEGVIRLLKPKGRFCVILPVHEAAMFTNEAESKKLFLTKYVWVKTTDKKKIPKRVLMEFELQRRELVEDEVMVIESEGKYTPRFAQLMRDFYLH